jgi:hypothetical protein
MMIRFDRCGPGRVMPMSRSEANLAYRPFQNDVQKHRMFGGVAVRFGDGLIFS